MIYDGTCVPILCKYVKPIKNFAQNPTNTVLLWCCGQMTQKNHHKTFIKLVFI